MLLNEKDEKGVQKFWKTIITADIRNNHFANGTALFSGFILILIYKKMWHLYYSTAYKTIKNKDITFIHNIFAGNNICFDNVLF